MAQQEKKKHKTRQTLAEILSSTSDVLFPGELGEKTIDIHTRCSNGDTPLHVMLWRKDNYGAKLLVDAGADVNAIGDMGQTPLHVAISQNMPSLIEYLLMNGAKDNIVSEFGKTPYEEAALSGKEILKLFENSRESKKKI